MPDVTRTSPIGQRWRLSRCDCRARAERASERRSAHVPPLRRSTRRHSSQRDEFHPQLGSKSTSLCHWAECLTSRLPGTAVIPAGESSISTVCNSSLTTRRQNARCHQDLTHWPEVAAVALPLPRPRRAGVRPDERARASVAPLYAPRYSSQRDEFHPQLASKSTSLCHWAKRQRSQQRRAHPA